MNEVLKLAKELQEYTKVVGSHNIHIQEIANELVEALDQPTLNENQQIVLEWLKEEVKHGITPIVAIRIFHRRYMNGTLLNEVRYSYESLNEKQENRVLQAFMDWVLEQEESARELLDYD